MGVVGLGAIGAMVANVAIKLGMNVLGYDPFISIDGAWNLDHHVIKETDINEIFKKSDFITLHVPLNDSTRSLVNKDTLALMKDGSAILNFARGELVDAAAAIDDPAALRVVYQQEADRTLKTPDGETFVLEDTFTEDEFAAITSQVTNAEGKTVTNHDYTNYVVPARQAYAHQTTVQHPGALIGFIVLLLVVLLAMATFLSLIHI